MGAGVFFEQQRAQLVVGQQLLHLGGDVGRVGRQVFQGIHAGCGGAQGWIVHNTAYV